MLEKFYRRLIRGKSNLNPIKFCLYLLSLIYKFIINVKFFLYKVGIFHVEKFNCKVISIGNITVGGTGKTPVVMAIASMLKNRNIGVASKGYARKSKKNFIIKTPFLSTKMDVENLGDEPFMIANSIDNICVGVGHNRRNIIREMEKLFGIDTCILDDGFHRLDIYRDKNILLVDATNPFDNGYVLPRGLLREAEENVTRADFVVLTKTNFVDDNKVLEIKKYIEETYKKHVLVSKYVPKILTSLDGKINFGLEILNGMEAIAISGIANPTPFYDELRRLNCNIEREFMFGDHYWYTSRNIKKICAYETKNIITTTKDAVKLTKFSNELIDKNVYVLEMEVVFDKDILTFI